MFKPWDVYLFDKQALRRATKRLRQFTAWRVCSYSVMVADGTKRIFSHVEILQRRLPNIPEKYNGRRGDAADLLRSDFFIHRGETCGRSHVVRIPAQPGFNQVNP